MRNKKEIANTSGLPWAEVPLMLRHLLGTVPAPTVHLLDDEDFTGEDHETYAEFLVRSASVNRARTQKAFRDDTIAKAAAKADIKQFHGQVPTLLATIGRLPLSRQSDGMVDIKKTLSTWVDMCERSEIKYLDNTVMPLADLRAIVFFLSCSVRAHNYGPGCQTAEAVGYNASVPLVLRAFKEYQNIPYSKFPRDETLLRLVDKITYDTITYTDTLDKELLMDVRLTHSLRSQEHTEIQNPSFKELGLNKLTKFMLTQLWVYRPNLYHDYCIHNPIDWDKPATPLVPAELFTPVIKPTKRSKVYNIDDADSNVPWKD